MYSKLPKGVCVLNRHYSADSVMDSWGRLFTALTLSECFFRCGASFRGAGKMSRLLFNQLRDGQLRPEKIIWRLLAEDVPKLDEEFDLAIAKLEGAAALLRDRGLDFRWLVAGEGGERTVLEKLIRELQLEDHFILLGQVENPYPLLRRADLYVNVSKYEGKSIAIREVQILKIADHRVRYTEQSGTHYFRSERFPRADRSLSRCRFDPTAHGRSRIAKKI